MAKQPIKTVVVSGGSRGLGQHIVEQFLKDPAYVVATCSRSGSPFVDSLLKRKDLEGRLFFQTLDISDRKKVREYVRAVRHRFQSVDILINNAALAYDGVLALQNDDEVDRMLAVNLQGTIALTRACLREMLAQRWGRVITISSVAGKTGFRELSVYSLTKAGLDGLTRSLSRETGNYGITVNSIAAGFLETEMTHGLSDDQPQQIVRRTPLGRLGQPGDIVPLVQFLCGEGAAFLTGQTIVVDGGMTA